MIENKDVDALIKLRARIQKFAVEGKSVPVKEMEEFNVLVKKMFGGEIE